MNILKFLNFNKSVFLIIVAAFLVTVGVPQINSAEATSKHHKDKSGHHKKSHKHDKYSHKKKHSHKKHHHKKRHHKKHDKPSTLVCEGECGECEGGLAKLVLKFNGTDAAEIFIQGKHGQVLFPAEIVEAGGLVLIESSDDGRMDNSINIYVNGDQNTSVHTSCSVPIGPGSVWGDFEIVEAVSVKNGPVCPLNQPEDDDNNCSSCKSGVKVLSLTYDGSETSEIQIFDTYGNTLFGPQMVDPGEEIQVMPHRGWTLSKLKVYVNSEKNTYIYTDCSKPVGPGSVWGDFTVSAAMSKYGENICPVDPNACAECKGGVTSMVLRYLGETEGSVEIVDRQGVTLAGPQILSNGEDISISNGGASNLGKYIYVYVDGVEDTNIHTSCSQPVGPGTEFGSFQVREATSKYNGNICGCLSPEPEPELPMDFGDAPESYGSASHVVVETNNPYIGSIPPDVELSNPDDGSATGDDLSGVDDEGLDGGLYPLGSLICDDVFIPGQLHNSWITTNGEGFLSVWVDWNNNGVFDLPSEALVENFPTVTGAINSFPFTVPVDATATQTIYARLRISSQQINSPTGIAADGEVEDCTLRTIDPNSP